MNLDRSFFKSSQFNYANGLERETNGNNNKNQNEATSAWLDNKNYSWLFDRFEYVFKWKDRDFSDPKPDDEVDNGENPPNNLPVVSLAVEPELLVESENTVANIELSLDAPPPAEGVTVTVLAPEILEFDLGSLEVNGGEIIVPPVASDLFGFTVNLTEQNATASIVVADDGINEGAEEVTFTLEEEPEIIEQTYQVDSLANSGTFTIVDTLEDTNPEPPADDLPVVSLSVEPAVLFESENTVANIELSLDAPPPEEGVSVTVLAPDILEFDLNSLEVSGGEIIVPPVASDLFGFTVNMTEQNATVSLAVADDGIEEGLQQVDFSLEEPTFDPTYQVAPLNNIDTVTIFDTNEIEDSEITGTGDRTIVGDSLLMGDLDSEGSLTSPEIADLSGLMRSELTGISDLNDSFNEWGMMQLEDDLFIAASSVE